MAAIREEADGERPGGWLDCRRSCPIARKELLDNVTGFAQDMAGKILGRSLKA